MIRQITIVGTGLIGGSLGLALHKSGFAGSIVGCDRRAVLEIAMARHAIDRAEADLERAIRGSDVIVLATPVGCILSQLEAIVPLAGRETLITDTGSTKERFIERARLICGEEAAERVLPGHPMAGREVGGVEHADPELFRDSVWLVTPIGGRPLWTARQQEYLELLNSIGARAVPVEAERHDRLCAWISHLPQMIATALASALRDEFEDDDSLLQIGGRALREMTRIAHSPYSMWRDIALTNAENIEEALLRFEQQLAHLRENLRGPGLREMFESANQWPVPTGQLPVVTGAPRAMKEGDLVRVIRVPDIVQDSHGFERRSTLEHCLGRVFPIKGFNEYGMIQIDVGDVGGRPFNMESIWIELECVEFVND